MAIHHNFVSAKADGADATLVRASAWNDNHVIDNATITYAMIQNVTNNRILGNNSGGAAAPAELTASQIFDLVSNVNGVLLTRTGGSWAALANVGTDNGDLIINANSSPVAPSDGAHLKPHVQQFANRAMLCGLAQNNMKVPYMPHIGMRGIASVTPRANSATTDNWGATWTVAGTATNRAVGFTNFATTLVRIGYVSSAVAGSVAGVYAANGLNNRGSSSYMGGFHYIVRFMVSDAVLVSTANMFVGITASASAPTDVDPSTLTNIIGVGCTNGDTVMQLYAAGSSAQARTSLGSNFPVNTLSTDVYEIHIWAPPAGSAINYQLTRFNAGGTNDLATVSGSISAGANLPANNIALPPRAWRSNGGTASAVGIDVVKLYNEQDF